jgi:carbon-monoxide dehydrogenase medium subunit
MAPFELHAPSSLAEALSLLDPDDTSVRVAGGCTALMLMMKAGVLTPRRLVSLRNIEPRYSRIEDRGAELTLGAQATLAALERSAAVRTKLPVVATTLRTLANVRVRNVATLGGHLAHADPHMDLPPVLIALGASAVVVGRDGEREVRIEELITGYYETGLRGDEVVSQVKIPAQGTRGAAYAKVTTRSADDWPALGVAAVLDIVEGIARNVHIAVSAATERPLRLARAEAALRGVALDDAGLERAAEIAADEVTPIGDHRGSAAYKRQLIRVHVRRALAKAMASAS